MPLSSPPGGTDHGTGDRPELVTAISGLHSQQRQVCRQALFRAVLGDIREDLAEPESVNLSEALVAGIY